MSRDFVYDFHLHTFLSDGALLPIELLRRCQVKGHVGVVTADHTSSSTMERVIVEAAADCTLARECWGLEAYAGTELTHVPAAAIASSAARAKSVGAALVVVHGESPVEPVEPGTNLAAAECPDVDILAHPGLLTSQAAEAAARNGVYIEVTARQGHGMANGHVVKVALEVGAKLVIDSDTHRPEDILTPQWAEHVALCAGIPESMLQAVLVDHPRELMDRARANAAKAGPA